MKKCLLILTILILSLIQNIQAKTLEEYVPVLPNVLEKALTIDPEKGFLVQELKPHIYLLTDGIYQSLIVTTGRGVILVDAPQSLGQHIKNAVKEVSQEDIKLLVYTHSHVDHIGGSTYLKDVDGLKILGSEKVGEFLEKKRDPRRLVPTHTFEEHHAIKMGHMKIKLKAELNYHSNESDVIVYFPKQKVLAVIDSLAPGYVPFMDLDLTSDIYAYLKLFDEILKYDFDVFVGGHITHPGTRDDVIITKEYVNDVYQTVKRVHDNTDIGEVMAAAAQRVGWSNTYLLFKVFLDQVIAECAVEVENNWLTRLAGVDVWAESHCRAMLIYVRWDD